MVSRNSPSLNEFTSASNLVFEIQMPETYAKHFLCKQLNELASEEHLKDLNVRFGDGVASFRASRFMLSLLSPVWRAAICGVFSHGNPQELLLDITDFHSFDKILTLVQGKQVALGCIQELFELGRVADLYSIEVVCQLVEVEICRYICVENCVEMLVAAETCGLDFVRQECIDFAVANIDRLIKCSRFMFLKAHDLEAIISNPNLFGVREESLLEAVTSWVRSCEEPQTEQLLRNLRFDAMPTKYLTTVAKKLLPESGLLEMLINESLLGPVSSESRWTSHHHVPWEDPLAVRELCITLGYQCEFAVSCDGFLLCGMWNGALVTVDLKSGLPAPAQPMGHDGRGVTCMCAWEGLFVTGSCDGTARLWNPRSGACMGSLAAENSRGLRAVAACGRRLMIVTWDDLVRLWVQSSQDNNEWVCEAAYPLLGASITSFTSCEDLAVSGASDGVWVWEVKTGRLVWKLERAGWVRALAVDAGRQRVVSTCHDSNMLSLWSLRTGRLLRQSAVASLTRCPHVFVTALAVQGGRLVAGSGGIHAPFSVHVHDLMTLEPLHSVRIPEDWQVRRLFTADGGCVGAVVNSLQHTEGRVIIWSQASGPEDHKGSESSDE